MPQIHKSLSYSFIFLLLFSTSSCTEKGLEYITQIQASLLSSYDAKFSDEKLIGDRYYLVNKVIDGDTFWVIGSDEIEMKVRLIGVDAPESRNVFKKKKEYYGMESKQFLTNLIANKNVKLEFDVDSLDQYGRTLAYAYLSNGDFLNEKLIKTGHATILTITPNVKYEEKFYEAQQYARDNKLGLWQ